MTSQNVAGAADRRDSKWPEKARPLIRPNQGSHGSVYHIIPIIINVLHFCTHIPVCFMTTYHTQHDVTCKLTRIPAHNYATEGAYFVTVCTDGRISQTTLLLSYITKWHLPIYQPDHGWYLPHRVQTIPLVLVGPWYMHVAVAWLWSGHNSMVARLVTS